MSAPTRSPPPRAVAIRAQAKVNLRLRILAREETGYHQIETLFLRLELADELRVRRTRGARSLDLVPALSPSGDDASPAGGATARRDAPLGPPETNLAWRAAAAWFAASGESGGWEIELEKHIPVGGGLGGGSADAGAVLRALDATTRSPLGALRLRELGAQLGADVPFLASDVPYALGWGRGERLLALPAPPARDVLLLVPPFAVHTAEAYRWLADSRAPEHAPVPATLLGDAADLSDWTTLAALAENDFEPVVRARHPSLGALIDALRALGCDPALLSGSGSVVFGVRGSGTEQGAPSTERDDDPLPGAVLRLRTRTATRVEPVQPVE